MIPTTPLPLLTHRPEAPVAWWRGAFVSRGRFLTHVARLAASLPERRHVANLCEDRYLFVVAFAAALARRQTNLLPNNRTEHNLQDTLRAYPDGYALNDADVHGVLKDAPGVDDAPPVPAVDAAQVAAVVFTSGSTGRPQPNPKTWGSLVVGARLTMRRFGVGPDAAVVATVPPQHMYGLETSVLLPLTAGACVHGGRPFFPDDVRRALAALPPRPLLVTTPAHLRVCVQAGLNWPPLRLAVSATAPLAAALADQAERLFDAPVLEIYGCSEGGSLASRRTLDGGRWMTFDGVELDSDGDYHYARGGHLPAPVALSDVIELDPAGGNTIFRLLGRHQDMVNVAGKRASLANLNHHLNAIEGVLDGVFVVPEDAGGKTQRLAALVVAPFLSEREILIALGKHVDPAFLPRPLYKVAALPRNETGKLPRQELLALLAARQRRP